MSLTSYCKHLGPTSFASAKVVLEYGWHPRTPGAGRSLVCAPPGLRDRVPIEHNFIALQPHPDSVPGAEGALLPRPSNPAEFKTCLGESARVTCCSPELHLPLGPPWPSAQHRPRSRAPSVAEDAVLAQGRPTYQRMLAGRQVPNLLGPHQPAEQPQSGKTRRSAFARCDPGCAGSHCWRK